MGRGPQAERIPHMSQALRHLRTRAGLTQAGVAEQVRAGGGRLSAVYYQQLETGKRFPSPPLRATILAALSSDGAELTALLAQRPWEAQAPGAGPSSASDPVSADLVALIAQLKPEGRARLRDVARALVRLQ